METFITALVAAVVSAPFIWPPFVMIYRYFQGLDDERSARRDA
jgi:hypothetical protein